MNRYGCAVALSLLCMGLCSNTVLHAQETANPPGTNAAAPSQPRPRLGTNLNDIVDYGSELPFVDVFRSSRPWISQKAGAPFGKGPELKLDEHGYICQQLEEGCYAESLLCNNMQGHIPSGIYTVFYDGEGEITLTEPGVKIVEQQQGRIRANIDASKSGMHLLIKKINPKNYIRNIRVVMPGFESTYQTQPFHPIFLKRCQGMACLRFMCWMSTNYSGVATWNERPKMEDATWTIKGAPLEVMVDLSNRMKIDPWFCMPEKADDDYVRHFASYVKENLDPSLKVYIEYSNEVWNSGFKANKYAAAKWSELNPGSDVKPWEASCRYYAQRSVEIFKIWEEVFGSTSRLQRTLAWQAAASPKFWFEGILLAHIDTTKVDALAIAPYLAFMPQPQTDKVKNGLFAETVCTWTVDQVLDKVEQEVLPEMIKTMGQISQVAKKNNLKLVAYEAGQHLVALQGAMNNEQLTKLLTQANASPRMAKIYAKYYKGWEDSGGDLLNHFLDVGKWTKFGSWGLVQYYDQGPNDSPKFKATLDWAKSHGQNVVYDLFGNAKP